MSPLPCLLKFFKFEDLRVSVPHICSSSKLQVAAPNSIISKNYKNNIKYKCILELIWIDFKLGESFFESLGLRCLGERLITTLMQASMQSCLHGRSTSVPEQDILGCGVCTEHECQNPSETKRDLIMN